MAMKKRYLALTGLMMLAAFSTGGPYRDGQYQGISRARYTDEPYFGHAQITIKEGHIAAIHFYVRDSDRHVNFDEQYHQYFAGNELYIQQCKNDLAGIHAYPDSLMKHQDPDKVDAISGATWSYNIFKASVKAALSQAAAR